MQPTSQIKILNCKEAVQGWRWMEVYGMQTWAVKCSCSYFSPALEPGSVFWSYFNTCNPLVNHVQTKYSICHKYLISTYVLLLAWLEDKIRIVGRLGGGWVKQDTKKRTSA